MTDKILLRKRVKSSLKDNITKYLCPMYERLFVIDKFLTFNTLLVHPCENQRDIRKAHVSFVKKFREMRNV